MPFRSQKEEEASSERSLTSFYGLQNVTHQIGIGNVGVAVGVRRVDGQGDAIGEDRQQDQILERCAHRLRENISRVH